MKAFGAQQKWRWSEFERFFLIQSSLIYYINRKTNKKPLNSSSYWGKTSLSTIRTDLWGVFRHTFCTYPVCSLINALKHKVCTRNQILVPRGSDTSNFSKSVVSQGYAPGVLWCCPQELKNEQIRWLKQMPKTAVFGVAIWGWHWNWGNPHAFLCRNTQRNTIVGD